MNKVIMALIAIVSLQLMQLGAYAASTSPAACRQECIKCAASCDSMLKHCHMTSLSSAPVDHIKAAQDCISMCKQSADFIGRGSALSTNVCALCIEACNRCAQSCETFKGNKAMQSCAQECRTCAQACQSMVK